MTEKRLFKLFSGSSHPQLAADIAKELDQEVEPMTLSRFANREVNVQLPRSVRGCDAYVIQTCTDNVNEELMELFIIIDALKQSFAHRIHAVIPHYGYARGDSMSEHDKRKPLPARLMAKLLKTSGADHVIACNLHSRQGQGFFDDPMDNVYAGRLLREDLRAKNIQDLVIVAPDAGAAKTTEYIAGKMNAPIAIVNKTRPSDNVSKVTSVVGDVKGRTCAIFDDMIDTAGTVVNAKKALIERGANPDVYLYAIHPVLSDPAVSRLKEAAFKEIVVTNTIPIPEAKRFPELRQISVAQLLAKVINEVHIDAGSVSRHY